MALLTSWWSVDLVTLFVVILTSVYFYFKVFIYRHWANLGLPFVEPSFPFGNLSDVFMFRRNVGLVYTDIYNKLEGKKFGGFFQIHAPTLLVRHPDIIKSVLVKDFANFQDRGVYHDEENDPISNHLFLMGGPKWKVMRSKMTPTFTSGKMKMMFETVAKCGVDLSSCVEENLATAEIVEMKDIFARYATDVIATCAFGIECNCLKNPDAEFRNMGRDFFKRDLIGQIGLCMLFYAPSLADLTKWGNTPKIVARFFIKAVQETVNYREKNGVTRNDFMQLLILLKNRGSVDETELGDGAEIDPSRRIDMDDVAAQAFIFFLAGFETSSSTMAFCLYELATNPEIQRRLQKEIDAELAKCGGDVTYDAMQEMEYLDKVVAETLRKYPPLSGLTRICNTAYTLPESGGVVLQPGSQIVVPVYPIHHDPRYYPEPHVFDPERFTKEAKAKRTPYTYMPFGEGPRICIGLRFGLMQVKIGLISLLKNYEFEISSKTVVPLVFDPKLFLLESKDGILLKVKRRS